MHSFFGISTVVSLKKSVYKTILLDELGMYKNNTNVGAIEITDDWSSFDAKLIANNPSQHYYYANAIYYKGTQVEVAFVFESNNQLKKVYFKLLIAPNYFRKVLRKWLNIQFTNRVENIGQIFHEHILVPMTFFADNLAPIHASGFSFENKSNLLGGTGGTGKTTLELEFCLNKDAHFITDDIAILNENGDIYPNYNYPKIYGYNLVGNKKLKSKILTKEPLLGKIHWFLHSKIFGLNKVRRKISPFLLFKNVTKQNAKLTDYNILSKNDCTEISKTRLDIDTTCKMTVEIILAEYHYFFNHLHWHEFNALSKGNKPIITIDYLAKKWLLILKKSLANTENNLLSVPFDISHDEFKKQMNSQL